MSPRPARKESLNPWARPLSVAQRSNLWPLTAWGYAAWRARSLSLLAGQSFPLERERALFLSLCRPQAGERWLDAGTSAGFYAGVLAAQGCRVLAADLSPAMLRQAQRREGGANIDRAIGWAIDWALLNLEDSGLPDGAFDGVAVGATLNETRDPARFLRELARLTRPGGQLWLMYVPRTGGPLQRLLSAPALGGLSFPDPAWVERQLEGTGARWHQTDSLRVGAVQFGRYVRELSPAAPPPTPRGSL